MLAIESTIYHQMLEDTQQSYPDECCGFLLGEELGDERNISHILLVQNAKEGDKRRRFEITPLDYLKAERFADDHQLQLLGIYHSHPNHPAIPSEHDRVAAQPYFSYVIVSIYDGAPVDTLSWRLNDQFQFEAESIATPSLA